MLGTIALKTHSDLIMMNIEFLTFFYLIVLWESSVHDGGVWRET